MGTRTISDLRMMQGLPLAVKVRMTETRIREWVKVYGESGVYISFSGGKDSTVLLHIVRGLYPSIPAVFVNTGLEYPEIQTFARSFENVVTLRPSMLFSEVISRYGYPFISKDVARCIWYGRKAKERGLDNWATDMLQGVRMHGDSLSRFNKTRWAPLLNSSFIIGDNCCGIMKKKPFANYDKSNARVPIMGTLAEESTRRANAWLITGCNAFSSKKPHCKPLSFWTDQDILAYIKTQNIEIASVYGDIVVTDADGFEYEQAIMPECKYKTTGCDRTGCIFCGFGAHLDKGESRFQRLKRTHPKQYDYCMGGGAYDTDGLWKPTKEGLGMAHCIDELCKIYGKDFIKY